MTAISDIPIVEPISGNKRHTYYSNTNHPESAPAPTSGETEKLTNSTVQSPPKKISVSKDSDKQPLLDNDQDSNSSYGGKNEAIFTETSNNFTENVIENTTTIITKEKIEEKEVEDEKPPLPNSEPPYPATGNHEELISGEVISSQTITSRSRTIETTTYSCSEKTDGEIDTTSTVIEQKVTIQSDVSDDFNAGEAIDHDEALAQAIQEATAMNPDMTVEKIEIQQTTTND